MRYRPFVAEWVIWVYGRTSPASLGGGVYCVDAQSEVRERVLLIWVNIPQSEVRRRVNSLEIAAWAC